MNEATKDYQNGITFVEVDGREFGPYCMACAERMEESDNLPIASDTGISTKPHMAFDGPFECERCGDTITD